MDKDKGRENIMVRKCTDEMGKKERKRREGEKEINRIPNFCLWKLYALNLYCNKTFLAVPCQWTEYDQRKVANRVSHHFNLGLVAGCHCYIMMMYRYLRGS